MESEIVAHSPDAAPVDSKEGVVCSRCASLEHRISARFCSTCGGALATRDGSYRPTDALRASYDARRQIARGRESGIVPRVRPIERSSVTATLNNVSGNLNKASTTALAFVTYSVVPYLGILFCPGALIMGFVGIIRERRTPGLGGLRASYLSVALGLAILLVQIFLWWILYKIPNWSKVY